MASRRGGVYLIRCRKPSSFMGWGMPVLIPAAIVAMAVLQIMGAWWWLGVLTLLFSGRHNGYVGMTNSFYHREQQHLLGDVKYGAAPKPWADLAPRFYKLLPLPDFITRKGSVFRGRWTLELLETAAIWLLIPVYNDKKQAPYNVRRISLTKARAQRWERQKSGLRVNIMRTLSRWALAGIVFAALVYTGWERWVS